MKAVTGDDALHLRINGTRDDENRLGRINGLYDPDLTNRVQQNQHLSDPGLYTH